MNNDSNTGTTSQPNAWVAMDHGLAIDCRVASYTLVLKGDRSLYQAIGENDWVVILSTSGEISRIGRVSGVRSSLVETRLYFDHVLLLDEPVSPGEMPLSP
ncbi:MAG TPA: hypothetical protein DCX68_07990, partial [Marinobacter hydrocarbonoclasticus]|nr:hypothetical protein [Marinobacter nauticus]